MIRHNDPHSVRLIARACHVQFIPKVHYAIARYDVNDRLCGGIFYTDYWGNGSSCQMHVAGFKPGWASKTLLYLAFHFPFLELKVNKVFGLVPEYNVAARNFDLKLGFKIEYLIDRVFSGSGPSGMYLMSMNKEDCKWLDMKLPAALRAN